MLKSNKTEAPSLSQTNVLKTEIINRDNSVLKAVLQVVGDGFMVDNHAALLLILLRSFEGSKLSLNRSACPPIKSSHNLEHKISK